MKREKIYFTDANSTFDNGELEKSIEYYKKFVNEINDEDEEVNQYAYLQLSKIFFSKGNYDLAKFYAEKIIGSGLFMKIYLLKEERTVDYDPRGSTSDSEVKVIASYEYSLKNKAKTIIGLCYLKKGDYDNAIENFEDIKPKIESYYYLGLTYGLQGNVAKQRDYYEKNLEKGTIGLIETKEWLNKNLEK